MSLLNVEDLPRQLTGYALARNGHSASQRAALAASIILGEVEFIKPTKKQIAVICGVSTVYVNRALALNPHQRELMGAGVIDLGYFLAVPTQDRLLKTIIAAGVERTWGVIETII